MTQFAGEFDPMYLELVEYKKANDERDVVTTSEITITLKLQGSDAISDVVIESFNRTCTVVTVVKNGVHASVSRVRIAHITAVEQNNG